MNLRFSQRMSLIATNKPFLLLVGVKFAQLAGLAINQAALVYFIVHVLGKGLRLPGHVRTGREHLPVACPAAVPVRGAALR